MRAAREENAVVSVRYRRAQADECDAVFAIFACTIRLLTAQGIRQWDEGYPTRAHIAQDIERQELFVAELGGAICGIVVLNDRVHEQCAAAYAQAAWKSHPGAIIHRICIHPDYQRRGMGRKLLRLAEDTLWRQGFCSIRLDAFRDNPAAIRLYQQSGYQKIGDMLLPEGMFCLYEKIVS